MVVPQGEEPPSFLQLFQGGLVIHGGKREHASTNAGAETSFMETLNFSRSGCFDFPSNFLVPHVRLASVLRERRAAGGGSAAGGGLLLCKFAVQGLCGPAERPAGGAVPLDWLQGSQQHQRSQQAGRAAPDSDVSLKSFMFVLG